MRKFELAGSDLQAFSGYKYAVHQILKNQSFHNTAFDSHRHISEGFPGIAAKQEESLGGGGQQVKRLHPQPSFKFLWSSYTVGFFASI